RLITTTVKDRALKRQMRIVGSWALGLFVLGYALWNVDNRFCEGLREVRHAVGLPWAWVLELHGWYVPFFNLSSLSNPFYCRNLMPRVCGAGGTSSPA